MDGERKWVLGEGVCSTLGGSRPIKQRGALSLEGSISRFVSPISFL